MPLVLNQATMSCCGRPVANCRCQGRQQQQQSSWPPQVNTRVISVAALSTIARELTANARGNMPRSSKAAQATLRAIEAYSGMTENPDDEQPSEAAAKAHSKAADIHEQLATEARMDGNDRAAKLHDQAASLHRTAASQHTALLQQQQDEQAEQDQQAASQAATGMVDNDDDDDEADAEAGEQEDNDICPKCGGHMEGGRCEECGYMQQQPVSNASRRQPTIAHPNPACCWSDGGEASNLCENCQHLQEKLMSKRSKAKAAMCHSQGLGLNRRTEPQLRIKGFNGDEDMLLPPSTMLGILTANAKAEGSNADLIGDTDDDYGYAQAGTYDQDQRTVHSASAIFGTATSSDDDDPIGIGAGMTEEDRDATNAARVGLSDTDHQQEDESDILEIGQGDRPATPLDRSRIGVKTDSPYPAAPRSSAGIRQVAVNQGDDDPLIPPTLNDMIALNRAEGPRRRYYDPKQGRMVNNTSAPGDGYRLPMPEMID